MFNKVAFILAVATAFIAPQLFSGNKHASISASTFPGWPQEYEGKRLRQLSLSDKEQYFQQGFPGKIARFHDGQREIVVRWVEQATRKLHSAQDCFKGIGYTIEPLDIMQNQKGTHMSCFLATKSSNKLKVCEYIEASSGKHWSDVSAWYWGALFSHSDSGWMSYVVAEKT